MKLREVIKIGLILAFFAVSISTAAQENVAGLFAIGTSARALGLGGAFSALADDESAVYYNPAGLPEQSGIGLASMFVQQFGGVAYGSVTLAMPYVGFSALFLDSGPIPIGDAVTRYSSQGVVGSVGLPIGPLGIGARWRFFRVSAPTEGRGWAIDPAMLLDAEGVRIALIYEGLLASQIEYETGPNESFGRSLTLGAALRLQPMRDVGWNLAFEASRLFTAYAALAMGAEAWIGGLGARVGFDGAGATFGLSVRFTALEIDWAYAGRLDLGDSHRVSLSLRF